MWSMYVHVLVSPVVFAVVLVLMLLCQQARRLEELLHVE